jgi:hypothetical protein
MEQHTDDVMVRVENLMDRLRDRDVHVEIKENEDGKFVFVLHNRSDVAIRVGITTIEPRRAMIVHPDECPSPVRGNRSDEEDKTDEIHRWLIQKYPEILVYGFDHNLIIYGRVQMGKTGMILALMWIAQYVHRTTCVLTLANMKGSFHQVMGKNTIEFNRNLRERFGNGYGLRMCDHLVGGGAPTTRVLMCNPSQLRRVVDEVAGRPYLLFVDEADTAVKGVDEASDVSKTGPLFRTLRENAIGTIEITATPFALYNQKDGPVRMTIRMRPREAYRGFYETDWEMVDASTARAIRGGSIHSVRQWIDRIVRMRRPLVEASGRRYMTILLNGPTTMKRQEMIALGLARSRRYDGVYVMNSDGSHLVKQADGRRLWSKDMDAISLLYDEFETRSRRGQEDRLRVYIIVAGLTASRAISFRPTNKTIGTNGLHAMLLLPSATAHCAQLIQYMRIWGNYAEDYPRLFCATTEETYRRIRDEVHHNLEVLADRTSEMGDCRQKIEGLVLVDTRRHDRPAVDDTHLSDRASILRQEFNSQEAARRHLSDEYNRFVVLTEDEPIRISRNSIPAFIPNMSGRSTIARGIRHRLELILPDRVPRNSLQISWNDARYEKLHHLPSRMTASGEYNSKAVVGLSVADDDINIIIWKDAFHNLVLSDLRDDTAYLFLTTRGNWRYYTRTEKRHTGILTHG